MEDLLEKSNEFEISRKNDMAIQFSNLGIMHKQRGELHEAHGCWERSCDLFTQIGSPNAVMVRGWIKNLKLA